jgi:DNA-directed RNA polymerase specialized sigma24 family protein
VTWDTNIEIADAGGARSVRMLEIDLALDALTRENPGLSRLVEMHYFGGMTAEEAAIVVGRSAHAVRHELRAARAWLKRELARTN